MGGATLIFVASLMGLFLPAQDVFDATRNVSSPDHQSLDHMLTSSPAPSHAYLVNSTRPFMICTVPKTGCSGWMYLLLLITTGINWSREEAHKKTSILRKNFSNVHLVRYARMQHAEVSKTQVEDIMGLDRILISRNPFVRFISSYFDWQSRHTEYPAAAKVSFAEFTTMYELRNFAPFKVVYYDHIDPVSWLCRHADLRYNLVLRVEEQSLWFDAIVARYDLRAYLDELHAWGFDLFVPLVDDGTLLRSTVAEVLGAKPWDGKRYSSTHHEDSLARMHQFYTPELARRVFELQRPDFELFGYPAWDGQKHTFRLV